MKYSYLMCAALAVAGCDTSVPDSGAGVGFGDYGQYAAEREARDAALTTGSTTTVRPPSAEPIVQTGAPAPSGDPVVAAAGAAIDASPSNPAPTPVNNPGISDEQSFDAVAGRETIESDAERLARQREQFQVIEPTAVPRRSTSGPNIVEYALSTSNAVGQKVHRRSGLQSQNKTLQACAAYASPDQAQLDFLASGGPKRDRKALDPDGDGFACAWDPTPFRAAAG